MRRQTILSAVLTSTLILGGANLACSGGGDDAESSAAGMAKELEGNVEQSSEILKDTYEAGREEGEGAVEAAGDAYEAVLEEGREKAEKKE